MTNAPELKTAEDSLSRGAQRRKSEENSSRSLTVFDIAAFFTLITSCISVALLALGAFRGLFALLLGLCAAGIFVLSFRALFIYQARTASVAAVLAVLALFSLFRFEPYRYEIGGQDQGAYVNISKHFDSSSTVYTIDKVRESVKDDPELLQYYDAHSHSSWVLWNKYRFHIPGIFIFDLDQSRYLFQFYHLHPLWMSIFAKVLGPENRSWSNVYFSFLSVCALALSLFYATKRKDIALLAAAVLAVHPLHAYFAKLPVSETPSLAFTALGLLYLVRFWDHRHCATYAVLFLGLSAASFFCLFLTRISGFLLMPFFVILYAAAHALNEEDSGRRLAVYATAVITLYMVSVLYGLQYSAHYSLHIYEETFARFLHLGIWKALWISGFASLPIGMLILDRLMAKNSRLFSSGFLKRIFQAQFPLFKLVLVFALLQITVVYLFWPKAAFTNPGFVLFIYVWPVIPAILMLPGSSARQFPAPLLALCLWLNILSLFHLVVRRELLYQYFYARYQFSDFMPFALILGVFCAARCAAHSKRLSSMLSLFLVLGFCYWGFFSSRQIGRKEANGSYQALEEIKAVVPDGALLLILKDGLKLDQEIKMGLSVYQKINIFDIAQDGDIPRLIPMLRRKYAQLYLLSPKPVIGEYTLAQKQLTYRQETYGYWRIVGTQSYRTKFIPARTSLITEDLFLYRLQTNISERAGD